MKKITEMQARIMLLDVCKVVSGVDSDKFDAIIKKWKDEGCIEPGAHELAREFVQELKDKASADARMDSGEVLGSLRMISEHYEKAIMDMHMLL